MGEGCCGGHCGCDHEKTDDMKQEDCCGKDGCECEDMSTADLAESNNIVMSALIEVLIRKGTINQAELDSEIEAITAEEDDDEDEETPAEEATSAQ